MGDARPGALEPLSRAVIKSRGLRGSKNEVQMRGGFEARAEVPGGGGVGGRSWEGSLEHPRISPGLGRRSSPGLRDWGALWEGAGGGRSGSVRAGSLSPRQRASLLGTRQRCLRDRFFFFGSVGCRAELLRFNNWETGRGRWQIGDRTVGWGGARKKTSIAFKGWGKHKLVTCTKPNPCEFLTFRSWSDRMGIWSVFGNILRWKESPRNGFCGDPARTWFFSGPEKPTGLGWQVSLDQQFWLLGPCGGFGPAPHTFRESSLDLCVLTREGKKSFGVSVSAWQRQHSGAALAGHGCLSGGRASCLQL